MDVLSMTSELTCWQQTLQVSETRLSGLKAEFDSIHEVLDKLTDAEDIPEAQIVEELQQLRARAQDIKCRIDFTNVEDIDITIANAQAAVDQLNDVLLALPTNVDARQYTRDLVVQTTRSRDECQGRIDKLKVRIEHAEHRMQDMVKGKEQSCPKCTYVWIPGFSESTYQGLEQQIANDQGAITLCESELAQHNAWLETAHEWRDQFVKYSQLTNAYPRLRVFWDTLVEDYKVYNAPKSLVGALDRYLIELHKVREKTSLEARIGLLNASLEKRKLLNSTGTETLVLRRNTLEAGIWEETDWVKRAKAKCAKIQAEISEVTQYLSQLAQLDKLFTAATELLILRTKVGQNQILETESVGLRDQAGLASARLQQSNAVIEVVEHLKRSLVELESDQELYTALLEELSPTSGLIADTLKGFVNTFVAQMNDVIAKVWSTPLTLLPCDISEGNLDYVFPVTTLDQNSPIADVGQGSTGEKDIIDFAFRLIAMLYLKIEHYPLLLDEVGASFHELHRNALFGYIKLLVEAHRVSQVFVVSHFAQTHGSLIHAELNVIDPTGVMITSDCNKHFKLK